MTANIFHSSRFRSIVECDVGHASFATSEKQAKLSQLAQKVICHLNTSPLERGEEKELSQFIDKIKRIDQRLAEDGHGSTLKTYIYALETLRDLRTNASPASQAIAAHDCMLYLMFAKDGNVLENPKKLLPKLTDFLKNHLLPALRNARTLEEIKVLQPLVADFIYLADRLYLEKEALGKKTKTVKALKNELVDLWNAKRFQTDPFYRRLLSYRKGQLGNLSTPDRREKKREGLNILIKQFKTTLHSPEISLHEKFACLRAIKIIEEEFAQHGDLEKFRVRKAFSSLLENDLIPAVENAKSLSELKELRDLFRSSCEISEKITSKAIESKIEKLSKAFEQKMQNLLAAEPKIARARPMNGEDRATIQRLSQEILDLEPVIGDANAYPFSASKGKPIDDAKTKSGSIALLAAAMRAGANEEDYTDSAENILQLGRDLLRGRSGQCDHMAAAVIAKIVEHIQSGRRWNTTVELIGNEGHAFILINRPQGDISDLNNWKDAIIVDTWLGAIGVHPEYQNRLPTPQNGVISDPEEVKMFAIAFGARLKRMKVHQRLSPQDLRELAQPR